MKKFILSRFHRSNTTHSVPQYTQSNGTASSETKNEEADIPRVASSTGVIWKMHDTGNVWVNFDEKLSQNLEAAFLAGKRTLDFSLSFEGQNRSNKKFYRIYFPWMVQQNLQTNFVRRVRRETLDTPKDPTLEKRDRARAISNWTEVPYAQTEQDATCAICLENFHELGEDQDTIVRLSQCGPHYFHQDCISGCYEYDQDLQPEGNMLCPICKHCYGVRYGNMPFGHMKISRINNSLPGFEGDHTIVITYAFPSGLQGEEHQHPGQNYTGTERTCYLPDNPAGNNVLEKLQTAFQRRLTFTVGRSVTNGTDNTVVWNGIHHKTSFHGGETHYGYPDFGYIDRVLIELQEKGVV